MNKKELQERLLALWELGPEELKKQWGQGQESLSVIAWQKKPNTAVQVSYIPRQWRGEAYPCDYGFAKVRYPDKWDTDKGIDLAVKKALASIARQIVEGENGE